MGGAHLLPWRSAVSEQRVQTGRGGPLLATHAASVGLPALTADDGGQELAPNEVAGLAHLGLEHSKDQHSCTGERRGRPTGGECVVRPSTWCRACRLQG